MLYFADCTTLSITHAAYDNMAGRMVIRTNGHSPL